MKSALFKKLSIATVALCVALGCDSIINQLVGGAPGGDGNGAFTDTEGLGVIDSEFSDTPAAPGETEQVADGEEELIGEETLSFFTAFQIDPGLEDSAGPKFVVAGDIDQDGMLDLVSGWNQSQPVQLHLQRRDAEDNISFRTITLAGTAPIAIMAGVELGQINGDGWLDVVVLAKANGGAGLCPTDPVSEVSKLAGEIIVFFSPGNAGLIADGDSWTEMILVNPYVADRWVHNQFPGDESEDFEDLKTRPENGGFTALAVGDIDGNPGDDIVVALNPAACEELGQQPPVNTIDLWINPGPGLAEDSPSWGVPPDIPLSRGVPVTIAASSGPPITDIALSDVDMDNDLDIVAAYAIAISRNVRWLRNPLVPHQTGGPGGFAEVVGGFTPGVDICDGGLADDVACPNGDVDCVGVPDGTCNGGFCNGGVNDGADCTDSLSCLGIEDGECVPGTWRFIADGWESRPIGQVDTNANVLTLGDIDGDGFDDVLIRSTPGEVVQWFRRPSPLVVEPEFPPNDPVPNRTDFPWPVFTLTEFQGQEPEAIAIGDVTGNGRVEVMAAAEGAVFWYDGTKADSIFDAWPPNTIIQDSPADATGGGAEDTGQTPGSGVGVTSVDTSTNINSLLVVDLDGDGKNDIVGTLDRRSGAGLSDDRLVWYRNTRTDPE